ncbi:MAG: sugar ABC transporter permease [Spirochaetaceae bacterium]|nr:sugar ABC transporter permease [Spirochaetaceae bacterium]
MWLRVWKNAPLYLIVLPTVVFLCTFFYYPAISGFFHSFTYWDVKSTIWAGFANYEKLFTDRRLMGSALNLLKLTGFNIAIVVTLPLLAAALVVHLPHKRAQYWLRVSFVIPMVVPMVVTILVWRWLYSMDGGINLILEAVGLENLTRAWLGDRHTVLGAIMFVGFPKVAGLSFLIYLAGLQNISQELLDAAVLDGANVIQRFFRVEVPLIRGQVRLLVMLTIIYWLGTFQMPLIMTDGGPGWASMVPGLRMYQTITRDFNLGYGSAIGFILFLTVLLVTIVRMRLTRESSESL